MSEYLFLASALLSIATAVGVVLINPRRPIYQVFGIAAGLIGFWLLCIFMVATLGRDGSASTNSHQLFWLRLSSAIGALIAWLLWLMKAVLLMDRPNLGKAILRTWPWLLLSLALTVIAFSESYIPSHSTAAMQIRGEGFVILNWALLAQCLVFLGSGLRESKALAGLRRLEMRFFVMHTAIAGSIVVAINLAAHSFAVPLIRQLNPIVFFVLFAVTTWAVSHHRAFDAKQIIASVTHQLAFLVFLCAATVAIAYPLASVARWPSNVLLATLGAGLMALALAKPTRRWFGIDRQHILQGPRSTIISWARKESDPVRLQLLFTGFLCEWCQSDRAEILFERGREYTNGATTLTRSSPALEILEIAGWMTPESLRRRRHASRAVSTLGIMKDLDAGAILSVPRDSPEPTLVVILGNKRSRRPYTYADIDLLIEIAELMDNIFTHTRLSLHGARLARAETVATLSGGLAHDLNNLTTPVASFLSMVGTGSPSQLNESEALSHAQHALGRMQEYIRESLFLTRNFTAAYQALGAEDLLRTVLRSCTPRATAADVRLVVRNAHSIVFAADSTLIQRLLANLVLNAIDASRPGSEVELSAFELENGLMCIEVVDHGSGIPRHLQERVFEAYFTTKRRNETRGMGLGLAIAKKIAELHGGEVLVRRSDPLGTTMALILPMSPHAAANLTRPPGRRVRAQEAAISPRTSDSGQPITSPVPGLPT